MIQDGTGQGLIGGLAGLVSGKKHLTGVVAAATIGGAVAGFALFGSEGAAQPEREPAEFSLTSDTSPADAVRKLP